MFGLLRLQLLFEFVSDTLTANGMRQDIYQFYLLSNILGVLVLLNGCYGIQQSEDNLSFLDPNQEKYVSNLNDFVVTVPSRVEEDGAFIGHELHVHHLHKRSVGKNIADDNGIIHYKIPLGKEESIVIQVERNSRLYVPATVVERRGNKFKNVSDSRFSQIKQHGCHLTGRVVGQANSKVAIAACDGLTGLVHTENEEYFIEPVKGHDWRTIPKHPHIVYKRSALPAHWDIGRSSENIVKDSKLSGSCGVSDKTDPEIKRRERWQKHHHQKTNSRKQHQRKKRSISTQKHVETLIVIDPVMTKYYQNEDLENYVLTIMNMVSTIFHDASIGNAINIAIVRIMILEDDQETLKITHHADNSLRSFCKWQKTINFPDEDHPNHHDVALLLTRHNICSRMNEPCSTLGLAQVAGLCQSHRSCNINEDTGLALAYTISHELGHNFGMKHDSSGSECTSTQAEQYVMAPHLVADNTPMKWSECSRKAITKFLDRDWGYCLDDEPSTNEFKYPSKPAGIMYDADHQCRLLYSDDASLCEGIEIRENICGTLWCRVNNKCSTKLQAAAEGTICGDNKWCYAGKCVEIGYRPDAINGEWGEWGPWTDCSRTCGAGISVSERLCENPQPSHGGKYCLGERKRYKTCNTKPCPEDGLNFRQYQCMQFNHIPYKNSLHEWLPVPTPNTPCQLHCKPKDKFFSVMLKDTVTDGTPCMSGTRNMCISGRCRHVGCDWVIDSSATEDICGVCFGDGSTCQTVKQQFNLTEKLGYVEAAVIPSGARNIRVEEVAEANNFLALRNDNGVYYLNGHWFIQWSGDYEVAGTVVHYVRTGDSKEMFKAPGPIKEPLHVMLLLQTDNQGIEFEYTVPKENVSEPSKPEFSWQYTDLSHCTVTCGGGIKRSRVVCMEKEAGVVDDMYCNKTAKPDDKSKSCNEHLCPPMWWTGPWQRCSVSCGSNGIHRRTVICVRSLKPDEQIALEDEKCEGLTKPTEVEPCHHKDSCPGFTRWVVGEWSSCNDNVCRIRHRRVECDSPKVGCDMMTKPVEEQPCSNITCGQWASTRWSNCSLPCGGGIQHRDVLCENSEVCNKELKPITERPCNSHPCPSTTTTTTTTQTPSTTAIVEGESDLDNTVDLSVFESSIESKKLKDTSMSVEVQNALKILNGDEKPLELGSESVLIGSESEILTPEKETVWSNEGDMSSKHHKHRHHHNKHHNNPGPLIPVNVDDSKSIPEIFDIKEGGLHPNSINDETGNNVASYEWRPDQWSQCSKLCGLGTRTRSIYCVETLSQAVVGSHHCKNIEKPTMEERCLLDPCLKWTSTDWGQCSATCGYATRSRAARCPSEGRCEPTEKPKEVEECNLQPCTAWVSGDWSTCTKSCNGGLQERLVKCVNLTSQLSSEACNKGFKPNEKQECNKDDCPTETGALTVTCANKEMSYRVCRMLKRLNHCSKPFVLAKCCRTCVNHSREKTRPVFTTR